MGQIPEGGKSLEQATIYPQQHEREELAKNACDASMIIPPKKIPLMPHPLGAEVVKMKHHQRVGIATQRGHGHKGLKSGENRENLVKKGEEKRKKSFWLEGGLPP